MNKDMIINAFDKVNPDEQARKRVLDGIMTEVYGMENTKARGNARSQGRTHYAGRRVRRPAVLLVAVLAFVGMTGFAFATDFLSLRSTIGEAWWGNEIEVVSDGMADEPYEAFADIGTMAMPAVTSNGITMTPVAAAYDVEDNLTYYLALRVDAPEGTVLDNEDSFWQLQDGVGSEGAILTGPAGYPDGIPEDAPETWTPALPEGMEGSWLPASINGQAFHDDVPGDNSITLIVEIRMQSAQDMEDAWNSDPASAKIEVGDYYFGDGVSKILHIPGLWLQSPDKEYTQALDGDWTFDLEKYGVARSPEELKQEVGLSSVETASGLPLSDDASSAEIEREKAAAEQAKADAQENEAALAG